ncbi:MAG: RsmE family RNA methyltransferase [Clostridia bacterium]|nr:RsmE family RNA methyltransferase [Clostridia bacterium]
MPRFFITEYEITVGNTAYIIGDDAKHIKKSLRMKPEQKLTVCDGRGNDFLARINKLENDAVLVDIVAKTGKNGEPDIKVNLYTSITKGEGFEYAIQKCVEAGVHSIIPINTERTIVKIPDSKIDRKFERWNRISFEAAKQSGRSLVPQVAYPKDFIKAIDSINDEELSLICYVKEGTLSIKEHFRANAGAATINIFIGPEGGFTDGEWEMAVARGIKSASLGKRILKSETAGLFATATAMYEYGELDKKA